MYDFIPRQNKGEIKRGKKTQWGRKIGPNCYICLFLSSKIGICKSRLEIKLQLFIEYKM
jgi:hypothetical protein